jgi:hypothetical protein
MVNSKKRNTLKIFNMLKKCAMLFEETTKISLIIFFLMASLGIFMQAQAQNGPVGETYTTTFSNGLGNNHVSSVNVSGSTIFAGTNAGGLSISTDGGATFTTKTVWNGLGSNTVSRIFIVGSICGYFRRFEYINRRWFFLYE